MVKSYKKERLKEKMDILDWELSREDNDRINKNPRQRILMKDGFVSTDGPSKSFEELWDGEIYLGKCIN